MERKVYWQAKSELPPRQVSSSQAAPEKTDSLGSKLLKNPHVFTVRGPPVPLTWNQTPWESIVQGLFLKLVVLVVMLAILDRTVSPSVKELAA